MRYFFFWTIAFFCCIFVLCDMLPAQKVMPADANTMRMLLKMPSVRADLQLVDEQLEKIEGKMSVIEQIMTDYTQQAMESRNDPVALKKAKEDVRAKISAKLEFVLDELLPHQRKRLRQLNYRMQLKWGNLRSQNADKKVNSLILNESVVKTLNLSTQQENSLESLVSKQEKELRKRLNEMKEEIQKMRTKHRHEQMALLNEDQNAKLDDLLGPHFPEFDTAAAEVGK